MSCFTLKYDQMCLQIVTVYVLSSCWSIGKLSNRRQLVRLPALTRLAAFFSFPHKMAAVPIRSIVDKTAKKASKCVRYWFLYLSACCTYVLSPASMSNFPQTDYNYNFSLGPTQHSTYLQPNDRLHNLKNGGLWDCSWMNPPPPPPCRRAKTGGCC